ncbi:hypothetical protein L7F22_047749 [Adiantum nelumboides]|nr:hypothetical protein [Adiantum nelumboides]
MEPTVCVQTRGGSRGRSSVTGPFCNRLAAASSRNGESHFCDDSAMVRWLQSAGLHHLAIPLSAATLDHRMLPELAVQPTDKPKVVKQSKVVPCDSADLASSPSGSSFLIKQPRIDDVLSDELQLDSSPGIFDIHMINTELLSEVKLSLAHVYLPALVFLEGVCHLWHKDRSRVRGGFSIYVNI